jgi:hypothetical protein
MSFGARVYNVMFASPSDVTVEHDDARDAVHEWNVVHAASRHVVLLPIGWDTHATPSIGGAPQEIINRQVLRQADLLVGIFWTRLGTATNSHASGTVEELERHIAAGKPAMLYFSAQPVRLDSVDLAEYERLKQFKEQMRQRSLFETYHSPEEFRDAFYRHLQIKLNDRGYFEGFLAAPSTAGENPARQVTHRNVSYELPPEAIRLLRAGSGDKHGRIMRRTDIGGVSITSNHENFFDHGDARSLARWDAALAALRQAGLIIESDRQRDIFYLTDRGHDVADEYEER